MLFGIPVIFPSIIGGLIFLIITRWLWTWYFKINSLERELRDIRICLWGLADEKVKRCGNCSALNPVNAAICHGCRRNLLS